MSRIIVELAAPLVEKLAGRPLQTEVTVGSLAQIARDLDLPKLAKVLQAHGNPYSETLIGKWGLASQVATDGSRGDPSTAVLIPFYAITIDDSTRETASQLAEALRSLNGVVASASFEPRYRGAHLAPGVSHVDEQDYLLAAPDGIGVTSLGTIDGHAIDGRGCGLADLDFGWDLDHDALPPVKNAVRYPRGAATPLDAHGSAVLGIIVGRDKIRGIAQAANVKALLHCVTSPAPVVANLLQEMESGRNTLKFGDVLLIELEEENPNVPGADEVGGLPLEVQLPMFRIIQQAVSAGLVVIEAAGNGHGPDAGAEKDTGWDLDEVAKKQNLAPAWRPKSWWSRVAGWFLWWAHPKSDINDSGAIMVGACEPIVERSGAEVCFRLKNIYNYGSRVDCHAWGSGVMTAGARGGYEMFGGTSAAAALVAGVALLVQQMARERLGSPLSPRQLRSLLSDRSLGTVVKSDSKVVGTVPDLAKLEAKLGDLPKLGIRAFSDDDGQVGTRSAMTTAKQSPDVLLCATRPLLLKKRFAALLPDCDPIVRGKSSFVYARLSNRGDAEASSVRVTAFWAAHDDDSSADVAWHELDEVKVDTISASNEFVIAKPIEWKVPANLKTPSGKIDIIVAAGGDLDPRPNLPPVRDDGRRGVSRDNLLPFLRANPNVALRTIEVAEST